MNANVFTAAKSLAWVAAVAATITLTGCASNVKTSPTVHSAVADGSNTTEQAWVAKGQTLTVKLPTMVGSNNSWRLSPESTNNRNVKLESWNFQQQEKGAENRPGAPACDVFVFRARHTGNATINFVYDCSWSPSAAPAKQFALEVGIAKGDAGPSAIVSGETTSE
jgi:predicted secreted protein